MGGAAAACGLCAWPQQCWWRCSAIASCVPRLVRLGAPQPQPSLHQPLVDPTRAPPPLERAPVHTHLGWMAAASDGVEAGGWGGGEEPLVVMGRCLAWKGADGRHRGAKIFFAGRSQVHA
jgi:hypothetical protein